MWDVQMTRPLGRISWRKLFSVATGFLVTLFAYLLLTSPVAHAADLTWSEGSISYQNNTYRGPTTAKADDGHELTEGTILYKYAEPVAPFTTPKVHVIYFEPGTTPRTATEAKYVTYNMGVSGRLSNKSDARTLTIDAATQQQAQNNTADSCQVDGSLGWIICPIANTLAMGMDWVFQVIAQFLEVRPLAATGEGTSVMMPLWNMMRNFANVAFVIAFMIIIYSQLTSWGVSNYGIKKILPRLVIAAILVNVSYWICAIAIDLSNIAGYSLQALFMSMREGILKDTGANGWQFVDWQTLMSFILAGGAAGLGATAGWVALSAKLAAFSVTGAALLILPVIVSAFLILLVVLFILAARQAIITLLVILAPLAFVAYILPNTEKWFERWRETFMTMLLFFPAFSLVFGGAQFAGLAIIQNAQNINMVILGMAVQIAPLAITPLILKFSGSLLGRIAGIVNDPRKGLVDRTRNWADERLQAKRAAEMSKTRQMLANGTLKRRHGLRRTALYTDNSRRLREGLKAINDEEADTLFNDAAEGRELARAKHISDNLKSRVDNDVKAEIQSEVNMRGSELHLNNARVEASKLELQHATEITAHDIDEYRSGRLKGTGELGHLADTMRDLTVEGAAESQRGQSAKNMQQELIARSFTVNETDATGALTPETLAARALVRRAAGVDPNGVVRAKANAEASLSKIQKEALDNTVQLLNIEAIANGRTLKQLAGDIVTSEINHGSGSSGREKQEIEAALEFVATDGNISLLRRARQSSAIDQKYMNQLLTRNSGTMKQKGGFDLQADFSLAGASDHEMNLSIAGTLGEVTAKNIKDVKAGFWADVAGLGENTQFSLDRILTDINIGRASADAVERKKAENALNGVLKMYASVTDAMRNAETWNDIGDKRDETIAIHRTLHDHFRDTRLAVDYSEIEKPTA